MAAVALNPGQRVLNTARRVFNSWRKSITLGDIYTLLIAAGLLIAPALALNTAGWLADLRTVVPIILLSIAFGFMLARSQYNELLCLMISGIYGVCFTILITALNQTGGL